MQEATVPSKFKSADLMRFINKAAQVEKVEPIIAYWCEYWIVNQILTKGLHNGDPQILEYTTTLMDKLELTKAENPDNDAILDDTAGQAYVEQFAQETFNRAENALKANKTTKQTASTFQAAATFYELLNIWITPDAEILAKIKYAKWNAVRILRAISELANPNNTALNQQEHDLKNTLTTQLDEKDGKGFEESMKFSEILADESHDEFQRSRAEEKTSQVFSPDDLSSPGTSPNDLEQLHTLNSSQEKVPFKTSLFVPESQLVDKNMNLFPTVPDCEHKSSDVKNTATATNADSNLEPSKKYLNEINIWPSRDSETVSAAGLTDKESNKFRNSDFQSSPDSRISESRFSTEPDRAKHQYQEKPPSCEISDIKMSNQLRIDDISMSKAQKHARWAISALNFEDTETAVRELREALKTLGAE